jgi:hypothetical protein
MFFYGIDRKNTTKKEAPLVKPDFWKNKLLAEPVRL